MLETAFGLTLLFLIIYATTDLHFKESIVTTLIFASLLLYFTFGFWGYNHQSSPEYQVACEDIYSLSVTTEVNGHFILGSGSVNSTMYYVFYTKDDNDLYKMSKAAVGNTLIKLDSSQTPKLTKVVQRITKIPDTIFGGTQESYEVDTYKRILIVPNNTIRQEYKVN